MGGGSWTKDSFRSYSKTMSRNVSNDALHLVITMRRICSNSE